jgi:hypothetical protein
MEREWWNDELYQQPDCRVNSYKNFYIEGLKNNTVYYFYLYIDNGREIYLLKDDLLVQTLQSGNSFYCTPITGTEQSSQLDYSINVIKINLTITCDRVAQWAEVYNAEYDVQQYNEQEFYFEDVPFNSTFSIVVSITTEPGFTVGIEDATGFEEFDMIYYDDSLAEVEANTGANFGTTEYMVYVSTGVS